MAGNVIGKASAASFGISVAAARRSEERARNKSEDAKASPEMRALRAAVLEKRKALMDERQVEQKAMAEASPDALRAVLSRGTVDELAQIVRMIGRLDGRRFQDIADEVFRERSRSGYRPDDEATQEAQEAPSVAKASSVV